MESKNKNFSGRIIPPWYDSDGLCLFIIFFMAIVLIFGLIGVYTALGAEFSKPYVKIPLIVSGLSFYVLFSVVIRLLKRIRVNKSLQSLSLYK